MTGHHRMTEEKPLEVVIHNLNGASVRIIARQMQISKNTISIIQKYRITRSVNDLTGRVRKKRTTKQQDRHLICNSLNGLRLTSSDLKKRC